MTSNKPNLTFWQIWNMSFGFLGVQYAFGLQQANMSPIYRYLGAEESSLPLLWLAGPITGLLIQPIIGAVSDRTWHPKFGRRRPFFLIGAIIASIALVMMPYSKTVWMAASLMWILDAGANVAMEPFRAFVADKLPLSQRPLGFSMQSFFVGFGQTLANLMPSILLLLGFAVILPPGGTRLEQIPDFVKFSFIIGAVVMLVSIFITIYTTPEEPPANMDEFLAEKKKHRGLFAPFVEVFASFKEMPKTMKQLWWVKFFTWFGLPLMWQFLSVSIARHCFNAPDAVSNPSGFDQGTQWGNLGLATFSIACFAVSFFIPGIAKRLSDRYTHAMFLIIGAIGFFSMQFHNDVYFTMAGMALVGLAWASIMSMPYVMLANTVPSNRLGVYMGIFNMFIVIPQMISMVTVPLIYKSVLGDDPRNALLLTGVCFVLAAASCFIVDSKPTAEAE